MERANRVHHRHGAELLFCNQRHLVFTFHDSLLEVVASEFAIETRTGVLARLVLAAFEGR